MPTAVLRRRKAQPDLLWAKMAMSSDSHTDEQFGKLRLLKCEALVGDIRFGSDAVHRIAARQT